MTLTIVVASLTFLGGAALGYLLPEVQAWSDLLRREREQRLAERQQQRITP